MTTAPRSEPRGSLATAVALLTVVRFGSVAAGFLASVLAARLIGADGLGLAGAGLAIATVAALVANGGLNISTVYLLGREPDHRARIAGESAALGVIATLLAAVLAAVGALWLDEPVLDGAGWSLALAAGAVAAGLLAFELSGGLLLGLQLRSGYIWAHVAEAAGALALTALILGLVARSAEGFLVAAALGYGAGAGLATRLVTRAVGGLQLRLSGAFARRSLAFGLRGQVGNVLQFLNLRLDQLLVPALLDLAAAGVYLVAVRVSEVVTQISSAAASFLFPEVAAQAERRATAVTERTARLTLLVVAAGAVPLAVLAEPILLLAFGREFEGGATAVRVLLVAMLPLSLVRLLAGDLKGRGRPGLVSLAALVALVVTVVGDLLLIPRLGIEGAALASLLAYTTSAALLLAGYRRLTDGSLLALVPGPGDAVLLVRGLGRLARGGREGRAL